MLEDLIWRVWVADWHTFYVVALVRPFWPFRPWKLKIQQHMNFHFPVTLKSWKNYENLNFFHIRPLFWPSTFFLAFFQFFWPFDTPCICNYLKLSQFYCLNTWKGFCYFLNEKNHCDKSIRGSKGVKKWPKWSLK